MVLKNTEYTLADTSFDSACTLKSFNMLGLWFIWRRCLVCIRSWRCPDICLPHYGLLSLESYANHRICTPTENQFFKFISKSSPLLLYPGLRPAECCFSGGVKVLGYLLINCEKLYFLGLELIFKNMYFSHCFGVSFTTQVIHRSCGYLQPSRRERLRIWRSGQFWWLLVCNFLLHVMNWEWTFIVPKNVNGDEIK